MSEITSKKRKLSLPLVLAGGVSSLVLALGMSPTFSAFTASIQNTVNTAGAGALIMQESDSTGTILCNSTDLGSVSTNAATCATINKYGANLGMVPGQTVTTTINIKDTGSVAASSFALQGGACTQSTNGSASGTAVDLCAKMNILIKSGGLTIYSGTAAAFATAGVVDVDVKLGVLTIPAGTSTQFTVAVTLDSTAGNTYQGLKISQPMTWSFGA
jgi:hypothetical protein